MATYYVAKYAISAGKVTLLTTIREPDANGFIYIPEDFSSLKIGRDIFLTKDDARAEADKLRLKKIASLKKQIAKLEAMKF